MRKPLLKQFTYFTSKADDVMPEIEIRNEQFTDLVQQMKPFLQEAQADLLQPRQEALAALFKKALS